MFFLMLWDSHLYILGAVEDTSLFVFTLSSRLSHLYQYALLLVVVSWKNAGADGPNKVEVRQVLRPSSDHRIGQERVAGCTSRGRGCSVRFSLTAKPTLADHLTGR